MFDSIGIFLKGSFDEGKIQHLADKTGLELFTKHRTGELSAAGKFKNLQVKINASCLTVSGSLAKYYFGNNLEILDRQTTKTAIEMLSDDLLLPIGEAQLYKLEFGTNLIMQQPVSQYFNALVSARYYERTSYKHGIQFINSQRSKSFYDKAAEMRRSKIELPQELKSKNILRYEVRIKERVPKQIGAVNLSEIVTPIFYRKITQRLQKEYFSIRQAHSLRNGARLNSRKQLHEFALAALVQMLGGVERAEENLISPDATKQQRSRMRATLREAASQPDLSEPIEVLHELDEKIRALAA
jgi:hypothetical protein